MNGLFKIRSNFPIADTIPLRYLLYMAMLSNMETYSDDSTKWAVYAGEQEDLYDYFSDWDNDSDEESPIYTALNQLSEEGLVFFDDEDRVCLGEFRGRKFFPFEKKSSLYDQAVNDLDTELSRYGSSKSAKDKSRARFLREQIDNLLRDVTSMSAGMFTELHGYLYEIYTGGEVYNIRNKTEYFQTNNILKAYDKTTTFAILVEGILHYEKYRKHGVPTLTNVAMMKDDVFRGLTQGDGSKDYMRGTDHAISDKPDF